MIAPKENLAGGLAWASGLDQLEPGPLHRLHRDEVIGVAPVGRLAESVSGGWLEAHRERSTNCEQERGVGRWCPIG